MSPAEGGWLTDLGIQARLVWRLLRDRRVPGLLKLMPLGALIYLFFPLDLIGPIDDAIVLWLGGTLFIELAPQEVVEEHRASLETVHKGKDQAARSQEEEDIIDADYRNKA